MEGRMEGKKKDEGLDRSEAHGLDDGGRILETQRKGTASRRMESLDIRTCLEADYLKKKIFHIAIADPYLWKRGINYRSVQA